MTDNTIRPLNVPTHPKERLILTAANLVSQQGWTATGINQILSEAGIPKGSFYYYFKSKEALGVAVLQHHHEQLKALLTRTLRNPELNAEAAIQEFLKETISTHRESGFRLGCPIGGFGNEIATQSVPLLAEAQNSLRFYEESWADAVRRGQRDSLIAVDVDAEEAGRAASMMLQGAFLSMKCTREATPLEIAFNAIQQLLFKHSDSANSRATAYTQPQALAS